MNEEMEKTDRKEISREATEGPIERKTRLGKNKREVLEKISFIIFIISGISVAIGVGLGSFIQGVVYLVTFGSLFVMIGIVIYIISQFLGE